MITARETVSKNKYEKDEIELLLSYVSSLLTSSRSEWLPPDESIYGTKVLSCIEDILQISSHNLPLKLRCVIDCTEIFDVLVPFFVKIKDKKAIHALLARADDLNESQLVACLKIECEDNRSKLFIEKLVPRIEKKFPLSAANIRLNSVFIKHDYKTYDKSREILNNALEKSEKFEEKENANFFYNAALFSALNKEIEKANECIDIALSINKWHDESKALKIRLSECPLLFLENIVDKDGFFKETQKLELLECLRIAAASGNIILYHNLYDKIKKKWPLDELVFEKLIICSLALNDNQEASRMLSKWSHSNEMSAKVFYYSAQISVVNGKYNEGCKLLKKSIAEFPLNPDAHAALAIVYKKLGKDNSALESAKKSILLDKKSATAWHAFSVVSSGETAIEAEKTEKELMKNVYLDDFEPLL